MLSDVLIGAAIGGVATLAGGFGGALFLGWMERGREKVRAKVALLAALLVTAQELTENVAWLGMKLNAPAGGSRVRLDEGSYRSGQLVLARGLPGGVSHRLGLAYALIPFAEQNVQNGITRGNLSTEEVKDLTYTRERMLESRDEIMSYRGDLASREKNKAVDRTLARLGFWRKLWRR